jgi:hypothetical protein
VQWTAAAKLHSGMRKHLQRLRREFPPKTADQRRLLDRYRGAVQDLGRELLRPRDRIRVKALNELIDGAGAAGVQYLVAQRLDEME